MKLDLRRPTLVLAGAWNPAIFRPGWIGRHVFGMPEGEEFTVNALMQLADGEQKPVIYINNVGFSVSTNRLELFAADVAEWALDAVEGAVAKIVELLPHTPILACGINFNLIEEHPSPALLKKIRSHDGLERQFDLAKENITSTINLEPNVQLNIQRQNDGSSLMFNFNFHRSGAGIDGFIKSIDGEIQARFEQAQSIMKDVYGLSAYEVLKHDFDSDQERESNAGDK